MKALAKTTAMIIVGVRWLLSIMTTMATSNRKYNIIQGMMKTLITTTATRSITMLELLLLSMKMTTTTTIIMTIKITINRMKGHMEI